MKRGRIFLVGHSEGTLTPMDETEYVTEDLLQQLLATYPDLLPGDQITPEAPRRWLLVAREMGVPDTDGALDRWSLDHLYLDQDGIPTFVECKRASDTRIRREVVAQMLDYAANGLTHWSIDRLRQAAEETAQRRGRTLDAEMQQLLNDLPDVDVQGYWKRVEANLRIGKVRLLFVADSIPPQLRRLVEFLNEKMADVEVLAVEIKQFLGIGEQRVMVPRLIGMTETAREKKPVAATKMTREIFFQACPPEAAPVFEQVFMLAEQRGKAVSWTKQGFSVRTKINGAPVSVLFGYVPATSRASLEFYTGYLKLSSAAREELRSRLLGIEAFASAGEYTFRAVITPESAPKISQALSAIFTIIETLKADVAT